MFKQVWRNVRRFLRRNTFVVVCSEPKKLIEKLCTGKISMSDLEDSLLISDHDLLSYIESEMKNPSGDLVALFSRQYGSLARIELKKLLAKLYKTVCLVKEARWYYEVQNNNRARVNTCLVYIGFRPLSIEKKRSMQELATKAGLNLKFVFCK